MPGSPAGSPFPSARFRKWGNDSRRSRIDSAFLSCARSGFAFYRSAKGSHEVWRRERDGRHTAIPRHAGMILKRRTLKAILADAGLTAEEFKRLLR